MGISFTYTPAQMLDEWKLRRGYATLRADCSVTRSDGIDLDMLLTAEIDAWYATTLATAPLDALPLTDIAGRLTVTRTSDGAGMVPLPPECIRIASVMMNGWQRPATITVGPDTLLARAQASPFARGGDAEPVAVIHPGRMYLYTPPDGTPSLEQVLAVMMPADGSYRLTQRMRDMIPSVNDP